MQLNSSNIINHFKQKGISVFYASPANNHITFDSFEELNKAIDIFKKKHIFIHVDFLEEWEVEEAIVTDLMLIKKFSYSYIDEVRKDVDKYNNKVRKLLTPKVGKEMSIEVFFAHEGLIYYFTSRIDDVDIPDPQVFLDELYDNHFEKMELVREKESSERAIIKAERLDKLAKFLLESEDYKKCTNSKKRKEFAFGSAFEIDEEFYQGVHISHKDVSEVAEDVWRKIKFAELKQ